jgi:hypothetical protein
MDPARTPPLAVQQSIGAGFNMTQALALLQNPDVDDSDLFSETENMNTDEAVQFALDNLA